MVRPLLPVVLALLVLLPVSVLGQTPPPRGEDPPPASGPHTAADGQEEGGEDEEDDVDRWRTVIDLAFTTASGNESVTLFSSEVKLAHLISENFELEIATRARYGRSEGAEVAKNYRAQLRFDLSPGAAVSPFIFTTAEHDPHRHLDLRANGGAGVRYRFWESPRGMASVSGALLYSYEDYGTVSLNSALDQFQQDARWSWRFRGRHQLGEGIRLDQTTFYQPVWNRGGDYLMEAQTSARILLNSSIALSITHNFERDSTPRPDVAKNDQIVRVGFTFEI